VELASLLSWRGHPHLLAFSSRPSLESYCLSLVTETCHWPQDREERRRVAAEARQRKLEDKRLKKKLAKLSETPEQKLARREAKQAAKVLVLHIDGHRF
jgi:hypothetical protein